MNDTTPAPRLDESRLRASLEEANLPSLLPTLYQLTGDEEWLGTRFRLGKSRGIEEFDTGGFAGDVQAEIRDAAVRAILAWSEGTPLAVPQPSSEQLTRMMSACTGTSVPSLYAPMVARHLGLDGYQIEDVSKLLADQDKQFSVTIIGAGVSGMAAAVALERAGIPYTILEKNAEVGGTWWENSYPGARVDIPVALYSFSFYNRSWSEYFGTRDEVFEYFRSAADHFGLREHTRFEHEVEEARWDEVENLWVLTVRNAAGETIEMTTNAIISAVGIHNRPKMPEFPGMDEFKGEVVHTARWTDDIDLRGKKVGVIGSAASAMQVVTATVDEVQSLAVFQRSPQWIMPNSSYFRSFPQGANWLKEHLPVYRNWYRFRTHWLYGEGMYPALVIDPKWDQSGNSVNAYSEVTRKSLTAYLEAMLEGRDDLIDKCTPKFPPFAKRPLVDNGWFAALRRPQVELVTDPIVGFTADGIQTSGDSYPLDIVVACTGFQQQQFLAPMRIVGVEGRLLDEEWNGDDARAYLGMTAPGFPNLFFLFGPNTNPPGGSWITIAEDQVRYITQLLAKMVANSIRSVNVRRDRHDGYNEQLDAAASKLVTSRSDVKSYYQNDAGRVVTNSPWPIPQYWSMIQSPNLDDFELAHDRAGDEHLDAEVAGSTT